MNDKTEDHRIAEVLDTESLKGLIDTLHKFVMGEVELSDQQVETARLIIDKAIPALKPVTLAEALGEEED